MDIPPEITPESTKNARLVVVSDDDQDSDHSQDDAKVANDDLLAGLPDDTEACPKPHSPLLNPVE